ncbi:glycosyltransferase family 2 protein [Patescibacteria group bacterium]|nr:glycosyltransferase family 2 protein [Patescibacteria group bacterium]
MLKPSISIIIPTYNHGKELEACLESILRQTERNFEIIIVNDGSTDDTEQILEKYKKFAKIIHQKNNGSNMARNTGFAQSIGEYLIFVDADVTMKPEMLQKMKSILDNHQEIDFVYSAFKFGWKVFRGVPFDANKLRDHNYIHTTTLVRRKSFPGFDKNIKRLQDWDVWLTMAMSEMRGELIPEVLFSVKIAGKSRIGSSWLPRFFYKINWPIIYFTPKSILKYNEAKNAIIKKHNL